MKAGQRLVYHELASEVNATLCTFCKYALWTGMCEDGDCTCEHPLVEHFEWRFTGWCSSLEPGQDCWAYRPNMLLVDVADIVGVILSNGFDEWSYVNDKEAREFTVYGRVPAQQKGEQR